MSIIYQNIDIGGLGAVAGGKPLPNRRHPLRGWKRGRLRGWIGIPKGKFRGVGVEARVESHWLGLVLLMAAVLGLASKATHDSQLMASPLTAEGPQDRVQINISATAVPDTYILIHLQTGAKAKKAPQAMPRRPNR